MNIPNNTSLNGRRVRYGVGRPDLPAAEREPDINHGGSIVVESGDLGTIAAGFDDWNGVAGLTIFRVEFDRGTSTHLSAGEFDLLPVAVDDVLTRSLQKFVVLGPPDDTPELRCNDCIAPVCDIKYGDTLAVLVTTALRHQKECPA